MKQKLPMLPWFPSDFLGATRHMTLAERGAYCDLLWFQWDRGPLPSDPKRLARLLGCSEEEFAEVWPAIEPKFTHTDLGLVNSRLEQHRAKALELSEKRQAGARKTNTQRWRSDPQCDSQSASQSDTQSESSLLGDPPSGRISSPSLNSHLQISSPIRMEKRGTGGEEEESARTARADVVKTEEVRQGEESKGRNGKGVDVNEEIRRLSQEGFPAGDIVRQMRRHKVTYAQVVNALSGGS